MNDRLRFRRDEDADKEQAARVGRARRENPESASILDLQAKAGNRAVAKRLELQRAPADDAPAAEPANEGKTSAGTMSIPDFDLVMPITSFMQQDRGAGQRKDSSGDAVVSIAIESLHPKIQEAAAKGKHFVTISITIGSKLRFTLHSVVITSFQVGSDMATLSLNFTSMETSLGG